MSSSSATAFNSSSSSQKQTPSLTATTPQLVSSSSSSPAITSSSSSPLPLITATPPISIKNSSWLITRIFKGIYGYAYLVVENCTTLIIPTAANLRKHALFYKILSVAIMITGGLFCIGGMSLLPKMSMQFGYFMDKIVALPVFVSLAKAFENFWIFFHQHATVLLNAAASCFSTLSTSLLLKGLAYTAGILLGILILTVYAFPALVTLALILFFLSIVVVCIFTPILLPGLLILLSGKVLWDKVNAANVQQNQEMRV